MVPLYLVLLCIPRGPRHRPPKYIWELTRRQRAAHRRAVAQAARPFDSVWDAKTQGRALRHLYPTGATDFGSQH